LIQEVLITDKIKNKVQYLFY